MIELLKKFDLMQDESIPGDFHSMYVEVHVDLEDGASHTAICRGPRGSWGVPMKDSDHQAKLADCLHYALPEAAGVTLLEKLDRLDTLDAQNIEAVIALMAAG